MIVTCPSCNTRYHVDGATIGASGRTVRCVACGHTWHQHADEGETATPAAQASATYGAAAMPLDAVAPPLGRREKAVRRPSAPAARRPAGMVTWVVVFSLVLAGVGAVVLQRSAIVRAWPPAEGLFAAIGLPASVEPYALVEAAQSRVIEGKHTFLLVTGSIRNVWSGPAATPRVELVVRDASGREVDRWETSLAQPSAVAGETLRFETKRLFPAHGESVEVALLRSNGIAAVEAASHALPPHAEPAHTPAAPAAHAEPAHAPATPAQPHH